MAAKGKNQSLSLNSRSAVGSFDPIDPMVDPPLPGNELAESLHTTMVERSQLVLQESASQLPSVADVGIATRGVTKIVTATETAVG
ncbi:hypothetical protein L3X38_003492 [Prunus dulcis]|uniref:Uncharacterized protein n=1 Tax=Prunus dulcis TaxID=3755 RepID=A0AAD4ZM60_PRUDU|nr:hypothetical protein L3X38_003492 [Prunus dulcis]